MFSVLLILTGLIPAVFADNHTQGNLTKQTVLCDFESGPTFFRIRGGKARLSSDKADVIDGANSMILDTVAGGGDWNECLHSIPGKLRLEPETSYLVEFDYRVHDSGQFYFLARCPAGKKFDRSMLRWTEPSGFSSNRRLLFTTADQQGYYLIFGIKGSGKLSLDNVRISVVADPDKMEKLLALPQRTDDEMGNDIAGLVANFQEIRKLASIAEHGNFLRNKVAQMANLTDRYGALQGNIPENTADRASLIKEIDEAKMESYRLRVALTRLEEGTSSSDVPFAIGVEGSLQKIFRDKPFTGVISAKSDLWLAANEHEAVQVVIIPLWQDLAGVEIETSDLKGINGKVIGKENVNCNPVGYVETKKNIYPTEHIGWWPDPLLPSPIVDIDKDVIQPFWISVYAPPGTPAGEYTGLFSVEVNGEVKSEFELTAHVWDFELPQASYLRMCFGGPSEKLMEHRITPRKAGPEPRIILKADGSLSFDFAEFDRAIEQRLASGHKAFMLGSRWGQGEKTKLTVYNEAKGRNEDIFLERFSPEFNRYTIEVWGAYGKHLREKGWLDIAFTYIWDEPQRELYPVVNKVTALIHQGDPGIRNMITGIPFDPDAFPDVDIMCPTVRILDHETVNRVIESGKEPWWYVCCGPKHPIPNFFTDYPAIDHRILFWMSWKYGVKGFLYWTTNFWRNVNPWEDPLTWPNAHGDGCLMYPGEDGPVDSLRLKVIRDGIEDYDYLYILREKAEQLENLGKREYSNVVKEAKALLNISDRLIESPAEYTKNPQDIYTVRHEIGEKIEQLNKLLRAEEAF